MIAGIDVGVKRCHIAIIEDDEVVYTGLFENCEEDFKFAGIDAPLSFPEKGYFRECERKLHRMGIRLLPPKFIEKIALRGIEIANELRSKGVQVYEVYPFATRVILGIAPRANKKKEIKEIIKDLRRFIDVKDVHDHNIVDAIISALTVKLYIEGHGELVEGKDGSILIPRPL